MNPIQLLVVSLCNICSVLVEYFGEKPKYAPVRFLVEQIQTGLHKLEEVTCERITVLEDTIDNLKDQLYKYEGQFGELAILRREKAELTEHLKTFRAAAGIDPNVLSPTEMKYCQDNLVINAIKAHRERCGSGLKEAKDAIEAYMQVTKLGRFADPVVVSPISIT